MKEIGKKLKKLRESADLTQSQMADILKVKQPSVAKYEHGDAAPAVEVLRRYADYFDVSMDYIFARTDDPRGMLYENKPKNSENNAEIQKFVELCFDPKSPFYAQMKEILVQMLEEIKK